MERSECAGLRRRLRLDRRVTTRKGKFPFLRTGERGGIDGVLQIAALTDESARVNGNSSRQQKHNHPNRHEDEGLPALVAPADGA